MNKRKTGFPTEIVGTLYFDEPTGRLRILELGENPDNSVLRMGPDFLEAADVGIIRHFRARQLEEPVSLAPERPDCWAYRNKVVRVMASDPGGPTTPEETLLFIKHCVLRQQTSIERIRREVQAVENLDRVPSAQRERIPENVRLFVWQRDEGKCVLCGSRERLEFDHIIPVSEGGSNTDRNVQLLCERCNRRKGRQL